MKKDLQIKVDIDLIAHCGLYCGGCPRFVKGKCMGCKTNDKSSWCKVRPCNIQNGLTTCAECREIENVADCKKFNPTLIRFGEFVTRTSRKKCIEMIKSDGKENFITFMAENKLVTIKKH